MEYKGDFLGKNLYTYDPDIECDNEDLCRHLSRFRRIDFLRLLSNLDSGLFKELDSPLIQVSGIPVGNDLLSEMVNRVVTCCPDDGVQEVPKEDLLLALRMCLHRIDKEMMQGVDGGQDILMRIAYRQFGFQERLFNLVTRTLYLYTKLWPEVEAAKDIDAIDAIESVIGISYRKLLLFVYMACGNADSYMWPASQQDLDVVSHHTGIEITEEDHRSFLDWCSADFKTIDSYDGDLNPITLWPVVKTSERPVEGRGEVYLKASKRGLLNKATSGIYFALIDRFNEGGKKNPFKYAYGYVFQEYVGRLLRRHFKAWRVEPECAYDKPKVDTVDWFVLNKNRLVLIEVKQSSIFLKAKVSGSLKLIEDDLEKTLVKAAKQLLRTKEAILSRRHPELERFAKVTEFESLIVVSDPLYNANYVGRRLIDGNIDTVGFHYSIVNISDLETLLAHQQVHETLFDDLRWKNSGERSREQDFKEFIFERYPWSRKTSAFLDEIYTEFFGQINVRPSKEEPSNRNPVRKKRKARNRRKR